MKKYSIMILILGAVLALIAATMDTTVAVDDYRRVHNIGLMNDRQNLLIVAGIAFIVGAMFFIRASSKSFGGGGQLVGQTRKCPFCAELIQVEAIVCKHCGRDVPASPQAEASPSKAIEEGAVRLTDKCREVMRLAPRSFGDLLHIFIAKNETGPRLAIRAVGGVVAGMIGGYIMFALAIVPTRNVLLMLYDGHIPYRMFGMYRYAQGLAEACFVLVLWQALKRPSMEKYFRDVFLVEVILIGLWFLVAVAGLVFGWGNLGKIELIALGGLIAVVGLAISRRSLKRATNRPGPTVAPVPQSSSPWALSRRLTITILLIPIILGLSAVALMNRSSSPDAEVAAEGPIYHTLDSFTVKLKTEDQEAYLHFVPELVVRTEHARNRMAQYNPEIRHGFLLLASNKMASQLNSPQGQASFAEELRAEANKVVGSEEVDRVIFSSLIVQ